MNLLLIFKEIGESYIIGPLIVFTLFLLTYFLHRVLWLKHVDKRYKSLSRRLSIILSIPIESKLKNLKVISQHSKDYEKCYNLFKKIYDNLVNDEFETIKVKFQKIWVAARKRQYKKVNMYINEVMPDVEIIELKTNKINLDLDATREVERLQRKEIRKYKSAWNVFKDEFSEKRILLNDFRIQLAKVIEKVEEKFKVINDAINSGDYEKTRSNLNSIERQIISFGKAVENIPNITTVCRRLIPKKMRKHRDAIKHANQKGIMFNTLKLDSTINDVEEMTREVFVLISENKINKAIELNQKIIITERKIAELIKNEQLSFHSFKKNYPLFLKEFEMIVAMFSEVEPSIRTQIQDKIIPDTDVAYISKLKKDLASFHKQIKLFAKSVTHKRDEYPYIEHIKGLNYMVNKIEDIKATFRKVLVIMQDASVKSKRVVDEIRQISIGMIQVENIILDTKFKINQDNNLKQLSTCKKTLDKIESKINGNTEDVSKISKELEDLKRVVSKISILVNESIKTAEISEKMYVLASRYASSSEDWEKKISLAEVSFNLGDYGKCLELSSYVLTKAGANTNQKEVSLNEQI